MGLYAGDVGLYAGDVGLYAGELCMQVLGQQGIMMNKASSKTSKAQEHYHNLASQTYRTISPSVT